jgi:hypothetical protein
VTPKEKKRERKPLEHQESRINQLKLMSPNIFYFSRNKICCFFGKKIGEDFPHVMYYNFFKKNSRV